MKITETLRLTEVPGVKVITVDPGGRIFYTPKNSNDLIELTPAEAREMRDAFTVALKASTRLAPPEDGNEGEAAWK